MALGIDITYRKLQFFHWILEVRVDKKMSTREYNHRTVYDLVSYLFTSDCGSSYLNPPPNTIDDRPRLQKISRYITDMLQATIYVAYENSVDTLTTTSDASQLLIVPSDYPNPPQETNKNEPYYRRVKRGYCYRKHDEK